MTINHVKHIQQTLDAYMTTAKADQHHRFNSWMHCFRFFKENHHQLQDEQVQDIAALHLGFYLASWGMMRGSTDLLQKDYRIHLKFIKTIAADPANAHYYQVKEHKSLTDYRTEDLLEIIDKTRECYREFLIEKKGMQVPMGISDTLVTKMLLGVFGNVPAYDRFVEKSLAWHGMDSRLHTNSLSQMIQFYNDHSDEFAPYVSDIYSPMKVLDMYFWQTGKMVLEGKFPKSAVKKTRSKEGQTEKVRRYLIEILRAEKENDVAFVELRSGDIHKKLAMKNRLPSVCNAMTSVPGYQFEVVSSPAKGKGSNLIIRYLLNVKQK